MEDLKNPELQSWMKAQNDYTRSILDSIPGRPQLLDSMTQYDNGRDRVIGLQKYGGRYFYRKMGAQQDNYRLYVRDAGSGTEHLLVDPARFKQPNTTIHYALDYFFASPDGKYVAYGVSAGGSENSVLHIFDVDANRDLSETMERAQYPRLSWSADSRSFFYNQLRKPAPGEPPAARYLDSHLLLHKLGESSQNDVLVLDRLHAPGVPLLDSDFPMMYAPLASPWLIVYVLHGVLREVSIYAARVSDFAGRQTRWNKIADIGDEVTGFDAHSFNAYGNYLYLLTHRQAPRFKLIRLDLEHPDLQTARVIIPESEAVLVGAQIAKDGLYVQELSGGIGKLLHAGLDGGATEAVALAFEGAITELFGDSRAPGAIVQTESWVRPPVYLRVGEGHKASDLQLIPKPNFDYSQLQSVEVKAPAADGTLIPLSIVYKRGIAKDGSHPTILEGYGAYGITLDPVFLPRFIPWLERGGIWATAHVRGGGEYGEEWHNAGRKLTKQNTIGDLIACAEYLVREKYTSSKYLAAEGGSAGGITVGGALTQRPDLFAVIFDDVGDSDSLRSELMASGPANIPEFGTVKAEEGFKGLYAMDAYVHVKDGTPYPAVVLTTGINDPRVDPWQAAKMAARLQAATSSGKPILLRVDYDAGHGLGSGKTQRNQELADEMSFAFWQFGDPQFRAAAWNAPAANKGHP
jgi:prolyl oligopeptidase